MENRKESDARHAVKVTKLQQQRPVHSMGDSDSGEKRDTSGSHSSRVRIDGSKELYESLIGIDVGFALFIKIT
ncbi:conserved hypothetical protein [Ricinus communis]|uniref:Uncharacterized protein n=1 Tax=Ricinus communis TaxID=3988 RepID=B9SGB2_RICCO|nr:conserved hypothetical protein [Ricinus communis]